MFPRSCSAAALLVALAAATAPSVSADVLVLKSGERRNGLVKDAPGQPDYLILIDGSGQITISRERVEEIIRQPEASGLAAIGDQLFGRELHEEALNYYRRAREAEPELEKINERIQAAEAALDRLASVERKRQALRIAELFRAARESMEARQFGDADKHLNAAEALGPSERQLAELRDIRILLLMAWGRDHMDKMDKGGASEKFQAVRKLAPRHVEAANALVEVWKGDATKAEDLRVLLKERLDADPNDYASLKLLADIAYNERQYEQALPLYSTLHDSAEWQGTHVEMRLRTVLEALRDEAASRGEIETAIERHKSLMERFPEVDPRILDIYDYRLRESRLEPGDEKGWVELAQWAEEKGMEEQARQLYAKVLTLNGKNEEALAAYEKYARQDLDNARGVFAKEQYVLAQALCEQIIEKYPLTPQVRTEAMDLVDQCLVQLRYQKRKDEDSARRLIENGDAYYNQAQVAMASMAQTTYERSEFTVVRSARRKAIQFLNLAVTSYESAMRLAPSLPEISSGQVRVKLKDSKELLSRLLHPVDFGFTPVPSGRR
jgi:cytochrome c-type biogenesis protein CcmH/NrfG